MRKTIVLSLGGSIVVPKKIDIEFLKKLRLLLVEEINKGRRFIIVVGGGNIAREYQEALKKLGEKNPKELDKLGIQATKLNAELVRSMMEDISYKRIIDNPHRRIYTTKHLLICGGWKPGCSTDNDAIVLAKTYKSKRVVNLTNIGQVHDKDPKKEKDAKPLNNLTWKEYLNIVGEKWVSGGNYPFDPIASKEAQKKRVEVAVMKGLRNFKNYLQKKKFKGTIIKD
jgi:uridylate kinase